MFRLTLFSLLAGLGALLAGMYFYSLTEINGEEFSSLSWEAKDIEVQGGGGSLGRGGLVIRLNDQSSAFLGLPLNESGLPSFRYLKLELGAIPASTSIVMIWRTAGAGRKINASRPFLLTGNNIWLSARQLPDRVEQLRSLGIWIQGQPGQEIVVNRVELLPATFMNTLKAVASDWTTFTPWSTTSINDYAAVGFRATTLRPAQVAAALFMLSVLGYWVTRRYFAPERRFSWRLVGVIALVCWIGLDLLWQVSLIRQAGETHELFAGLDPGQKRTVSFDADLFAFTSEVKQQITTPSARVFVFSESDYRGMKGAYFLYPLNVYWRRHATALPAARHLVQGDYLVILETKQMTFDPDAGTLAVGGQVLRGVESILSRPRASLFRVQ